MTADRKPRLIGWTYVSPERYIVEPGQIAVLGGRVFETEKACIDFCKSGAVTGWPDVQIVEISVK